MGNSDLSHPIRSKRNSLVRHFTNTIWSFHGTTFFSRLPQATCHRVEDLRDDSGSTCRHDRFSPSPGGIVDTSIYNAQTSTDSQRCRTAGDARGRCAWVRSPHSITRVPALIQFLFVFQADLPVARSRQERLDTVADDSDEQTARA